MEQTWKCFIALLLTCSITAQSSECRILQDVSGGALVRYTETPAAGRSCSTVCTAPLLFANAFKSQPTSYACVANLGSGLLGYQAGTGSATCTVANGNEVLDSPDYSCLCLASSAVPGLSKPDPSSNCASSCQPFAGETGSPVSAAGSSVCMAISEAGSTNHFGSVSAAGSCTFVSGKAVTQTTAYSCVCAYGGSTTTSSTSSQTPVGAVPFQTPQPQIQTAG